jgi:F0F1-type ATP synthase membrane subunit c/vacuolar-type H+-ATPase subunit K
MNRKLAGAALLVVAAVASIPQATAADVGVAGAFSRGRTHFVVTGGTGYAFDESYFVLGLGVSYYVIDGLNVGLFLESWSGSDPHLYKVTPSVQYVFHRVPVLKPYIGAFYRRTYVEGLSDINSVGGRAGVYLQAGRNAYLGAGAVYESYVDCNETVYRSCTNTYPELSFTVAF